MPRSVLIDTDVLVDFLRGLPAAVTLVKRNSEHIILSSIVVAELYAGVKGDKEQATLDDFVAAFPVIAVSTEIAKRGGLYKARYAASHGVGLADAVIAATIEFEDARVKTLNTKHYPMFPTLQPAYNKTWLTD